MELESKMRWDEMEGEKMERKLLFFGGAEMRDREGKMELINEVVGILAPHWLLVCMVHISEPTLPNFMWLKALLMGGKCG